MKKILFITGTRADYGKMKPLIQEIEKSKEFEAYVYVSGMHLVDILGSTYREILKDGYKNIYVDYGLKHTESMSYNLGDVISRLTGYMTHLRPDMVVVHGDRIDALAGAVVGALNNIKVAHIEGGEISGTIDESIRHAVSKFAHVHFVCNEEAKQRLVQLGEDREHIYVIGSPDIDIMLSEKLPPMETVCKRYDICFENYGIFMYHPVTTEEKSIAKKIREVVDALIESGRQYIVIYPNDDKGSETILNEYQRLKENKNFRVFPSIRFEYFLTLLRNADFMIGNSSAGIRETCVYGIPSIDIGSRQQGRYTLDILKNIQHVTEDKRQIAAALDIIDDYHKKNSCYGDGKSVNKFMEVLRADSMWKFDIQKKFYDYEIY